MTPGLAPAALAAALLLAAAAWVLLDGSGVARQAALRPLDHGPGGEVADGRGDSPAPPVGPRFRVLLVVAAATTAVAVLPPRRCALVLVLGAVAVAVARAVRRRGEEREAAERRTHVVSYAEALVGELDAGMPVVAALERAGRSWDEAVPVAAAARWGASVPDALQELARRPGAESVRRLAAVWQLCAGSGASLAVGVGHVLETARAEEATRHVVAAELASARATARMLAVMPMLVLVAGEGLGAQPWRFLLDSAPGLACLAAGAACALTGLWWLDRIAERAVRGPA